MSCLNIRFDIMKATILDFLVSCSLITAMCSLIFPVILCRHSLKRPNKNKNKTNCLQIAFHFLQPRVSFYFWEMFTFIFPNMVPPSLNLSCHLLSPPIRPPIHPIVNSCPSLKRTSTLTFTFSIQFSTVNWPCYECGPIEHNFPKLGFWPTEECHISCFFSLFWHSQYRKFQYCHQWYNAL